MRIKWSPDPDTFEKYRDAPPISIAMLLQKYPPLLAESSVYTKLYHDAPPICIATLLQTKRGQGRWDSIRNLLTW